MEEELRKELNNIFSNLNGTQISIENASRYINYRRDNAKFIITVWYSFFKEARQPIKLYMFYVLHELIKDEAKLNPQYFVPYINQIIVDVVQTIMDTCTITICVSVAKTISKWITFEMIDFNIIDSIYKIIPQEIRDVHSDLTKTYKSYFISHPNIRGNPVDLNTSLNSLVKRDTEKKKSKHVHIKDISVPDYIQSLLKTNTEISLLSTEDLFSRDRIQKAKSILDYIQEEVENEQDIFADQALIEDTINDYIYTTTTVEGEETKDKKPSIQYEEVSKMEIQQLLRKREIELTTKKEKIESFIEDIQRIIDLKETELSNDEEIHLRCVDMKHTIEYEKELFIPNADVNKKRFMEDSRGYTSQRNGTGFISSTTVYGSLYGMETFSQMVSNGSLSFSSIDLYDSPEFHHRALLLDAGRRFVPIHTVYSILDSMSYLKMNVLHFHLTDFGRAAVESLRFPQLTKHLIGSHDGYYTQKEVKDIVNYAKERGIRVIPEIDFPGHTYGMRGLSEVGMQFCDDTLSQLYDDPQNRTYTILTQYLEEMFSLFPDDYVYYTLGKIPITWEETLFLKHSILPVGIVNVWNGYSVKSAINKGYTTVQSHNKNLYLNLIHHDISKFWYDIGPKTSTVSPTGNLLGIHVDG
ncbi:hypothetical protein WA158_006112 [Blastocystis sp. Blastoise]